MGENREEKGSESEGESDQIFTPEKPHLKIPLVKDLVFSTVSWDNLTFGVSYNPVFPTSLIPVDRNKVS